MVLIVVLLQPVEVGAWILAGIGVVQGVVDDVVGHVADQVEGPEERKQNGVLYRNHLNQRCPAYQNGDDGQEWGEDEAVAGLTNGYGSLGSM